MAAQHAENIALLFILQTAMMRMQLRECEYHIAVMASMRAAFLACMQLQLMRLLSTGQLQQGWVYTLQLRLEDATGELDALLFDEDGQEFFEVPSDDIIPTLNNEQHA